MHDRTPALFGRTAFLFIAALVVWLTTGGLSVFAQAPAAAPPAVAKPAASTMDLIQASGLIGLAIVMLSIAGVALVLENLLVLRRSAVVPEELAEELAEQVGAGNLKDAEITTRKRPCYLSHVIAAGLAETRYGYQFVEKAMEDASQAQAAQLFRRVEYLSLIGNLAPMLGLLGTVYGLVLAFKKVAESQGTALAADLADGIYLALVTTVEGLVVSIPALAAAAVFRGWIEQLADETNQWAQRIFVGYRHARHNRKSSSEG